MTWTTFSPDGRQVKIDRDDHGWVVSVSDAGRGASRSLGEALAIALGHPVERSLIVDTSAEARWIRQQAARIEAEVGAESRGGGARPALPPRAV